MKIKLHIVLNSKSTRRPKFEKLIDYEITPENFGECVAGYLTVQIGENFYKITFLGKNWDKRTSTLNAESEMRSCECNGYLKTLKDDGWEEIT